MESLCIAADLRMYDNKREKAVPEKHHPKSEMSTIQAPKERDSSRRRFPH
jgi:hypothetical protein